MSSKRTDVPQQLPLAQFQPHKGETYIFRVDEVAQYKAQQGLNFRVPPGAIVTLRSLSTNGINSLAVAVSQYAEGYIFDATANYMKGHGIVLPPGDAVTLPWSVDNLNELWFFFALALGANTIPDGVSITVQIPSVG